MLSSGGEHFGKRSRPGRRAGSGRGEERPAGAAAGPVGPRDSATRLARWTSTCNSSKRTSASSPRSSAQQLTGRLEIIHGELHRLESIVENFLRLTSPSALDLEPVTIPKLVTHVCELLRPEAAAREIEIVTRLDDGLPEVVADPARLTQALFEPLINAMQAVERKGRIVLSGTVAAGSLNLSVTDTGPGILPDKLARSSSPISPPSPKAAVWASGLPSKSPPRMAAPSRPPTPPPVAPSSR